MSSKEKAIALISKMLIYSDAQDGPWMDKDMAKQCALIAVDEIIKSRPQEPRSYTDTMLYWGEVKNEIEKL
jgi:hypothetical protein